MDASAEFNATTGLTSMNQETLKRVQGDRKGFFQSSQNIFTQNIFLTKDEILA